MAHPWIETGFNRGPSAAGQCRDSSIEIGEKTGAVMRRCDQVVFDAVQHQRFTSSLMQCVEDRTLVGQKAQGLVRTALAHDLAARVPRASVAVQVATARKDKE